MEEQGSGKTSPLDALKTLDEREEQQLHPAATKSSSGIRRRSEPFKNYRQNFALDADRILHSRAYVRYIDKTQVFSLISNDHITHRVLHVQLVARIARTIGRFLGLNEDLIEAIALGHDIGHPPFGHDGETFLSEICQEYGLPPFQHNIQSIHFLDKLERKGKGWNLTLQVLDGILCHDGEVHSDKLRPEPIDSFDAFDLKLNQKSKDPSVEIIPATPEGCVVRIADTIGYIGKDIEDAIILGLITREDIPKKCKTLLGSTNGTIVYSLVTDLIDNSTRGKNSIENIGFSRETSLALKELKAFNYERIYLDPTTKEQNPLIHNCYKKLFEYYLTCIREKKVKFPEKIDLMSDITPILETTYSPEERVRDFIAGMTDDYFLKQAANIGCQVPIKK